MSVYTEFLLIAAALYLWESGLWLPLPGVGLRRWGAKWKALPHGQWMALRETGLVPMLPFPPDRGLAPCQTPPLMVDAAGNFGLAGNGEDFHMTGPLAREDMRPEPHHLVVRENDRVRISSPRCLAVLSRARRGGLEPAVAVRRMWRLALSPPRAAREWRRWRRVSARLAWLGPMLAAAFFAGLPLAYVFGGAGPTLMMVVWIWALMVLTAGQLWWLGKRVYPGARSALRMDALLSLIIPFHAMRALEIASVHAMATTHPAALLVAVGDLENPWLAGFLRRIRHPRPGKAGDAACRSALLPLVERIPTLEMPPDRTGDAGARSWCPRCHGVYRENVTECPDCGGLPLHRF